MDERSSSGSDNTLGARVGGTPRRRRRRRILHCTYATEQEGGWSLVGLVGLAGWGVVVNGLGHGLARRQRGGPSPR